MPLSPGTYIIHNVDSGKTFDYWFEHHIFACYPLHRDTNQQFHIRPYLNDSGYTIQNVRSRWYVRVDGNELRDSCRHDKVIWSLEHQFGDVYAISILGTKSRMWFPDRPENKDNLVYISERDATDGCLWRFERISEDAGDLLDPSESISIPVSSPQTFPVAGGANAIIPKDATSPYIDDAHFHTDMLFNMPRTPFTRTQRAAVLEWARKLGTANVPTMESFDECERMLEAGRSDGNNAGRHGRFASVLVY